MADENLLITINRTEQSLPAQVEIPENTRSIMFRDIAPNENRAISYSIKNYGNPFDVGIVPIAQSKEEFVAQLQESYEMVRLQLLNSTVQLPPQFASGAIWKLDTPLIARFSKSESRLLPV